jgi:hypothetical protein
MFLNFTNHPHSNWSEKQTSCAKTFGEIVDMPFPEISPYLSREGIEALSQDYLTKIIALNPNAVLLQGEMTFTFCLTNMLLNSGIKVLAACSERVTSEKVDTEGKTVRLSTFEFVQFREY